MFKKIITGLFLITAVLIFNATTGFVQASTYSVGDSFTFTISKLTESIKVNGTEYELSIINSAFNKTNTYTITNMNSTIIELSYPYGNVNKKTYTVVDGFEYFMFTYLLLGYLLFTFSVPGSNDYSEPNLNNAIYIDQTNFFPMFASGNTKIYQTLINSSPIADANATNTDSYFSYTTNIMSTFSNQSNNKYLLSYRIDLTKTNSTIQFLANLDTSAKVVIDLTRNVLTEMSFTFNFKVNEGNASLNTVSMVSIIEGSSNPKNNIHPISFTYIMFISLMSTIIILILFRVRRKPITVSYK